MSNKAMANTAQALMDSMTPKFAVSYLRVSTRGQAERGGGHDEGFSIPAQREANKKKALSMGAMVGKEFVDRGASAKSADRPQLQAMLEYVKENADRVDYVIVHKVDRLARNRDDDSDIMRVLRECGVQLVSASESIDDTPSGMLLHGIMSSIAEFYSQNLATEVKKGMGEKVKGGGTIGRAPLGYLNVRRVDEKGREERTVELDPDRAPLIKLAFDEFSTGNWTISELADHLASCGLTTRSTPKISSEPINKKSLNKILVNPYYKGVVRYNGVEYDGIHESLVTEEKWEKVQTVLASHINGERTMRHPHFLKSSVYCGYCGSRLIIDNTVKKNGAVYPYFTCAGRHSKRNPDCKMKYILTSIIEIKIEEIYDRLSIPPELKEQIHDVFKDVILKEKEKYAAELNGLVKEKEKLEHRRKKLLEAHYCDAIPLDLMKSEQKEIAKKMAAIEHEIKMHNITFDEILANMESALELIEDCGKTYRAANESTKRMLNQSIFKRLKVYIDDDSDEVTVEPELAKPFDMMLEPIKADIPVINKSKLLGVDKLSESIENAIRHSKEFFESGGLPHAIQTYQNDSNFFEPKSSSKDFLVDVNGLEPLTLCTSSKCSTN